MKKNKIFLLLLIIVFIFEPTKVQCNRLYGQIEYLENSNSQKLDLSNNYLNYYPKNGKIDSFDKDMLGLWHGRLQINSLLLTDNFKTRDPNETSLYETYCKPGFCGACNLEFKQNKKEIIYLKPLKILFCIMHPKIESYELNLDNINHGTSLGHNLIKSSVEKNDIFKLDDNTYEQYLLSKEYTKIKSTKTEFSDYSLSVIRLKINRPQNTIDIIVGVLSYDEKGQLLSKNFLSGSLEPGKYSFFDKIKAAINY